MELLPKAGTTSFLLEPTMLEWAAKLAGALAGSLISIAYILPRGRREALLRFSVGIVTGLVLGGTVGVKATDALGLLGKISVTEMALMGATLSSLCAWWGLGVLQRLVEQWPPRISKATILSKLENFRSKQGERT